MNQPIHTFHIPVMGLGYTVDSPAKVARYGISSVVSIAQDSLIEKMRQYYYKFINSEYKPISIKEDDYRAKRITDYLNLLNKIVHEQFEKLKKSAFEAGSDLVLYFEMLPNDSKIKKLYHTMLETNDGKLKEKLQENLRSVIKPGSIDVNIMSKLDRNRYDTEGNVIEDHSDAVATLRGYINSDLKDSSIVFSAGMNPRLYNYIAKFIHRFRTEKGTLEKKVVIKVSDYRSAIIQGKYLAKKGIWVSEFRIESGLNCGGHAFATEGFLLGPILEEFKTNREALTNELFDLYKQAFESKGIEIPKEIPRILITVQGGIGTHEEHEMLREYYKVDSAGWGTPFLLVPEATSVDDETIEKLCQAKEEDIILSRNSPLGVRFNYLKGLSGEKEKYERFENGNPGSLCTEKFLAFNTEFSKEPICTASATYQKKKIESLKDLNLPDDEYDEKVKEMLNSECLCVNLCNSTLISHDLGKIKNNSAGITICPGPNIAYFNKKYTLKEMTDHIYGRTDLIQNEDRPHFLIKELSLYIDYFKELFLEKHDEKNEKYFKSFGNNLLNGINYYKQVLSNVFRVKEKYKERIKNELNNAEMQINEMITMYSKK